MQLLLSIVESETRLIASAGIGSPEGSAKTRADSLGEMGAWIANGLKGDPTSWMLSTAASLYWRVVGMPDEAVACLRHALHYCPQSYRDIPLFGLSDVFLASGLNNHALILAHSALDLTDNFLINFAIGCIHVRKVHVFMISKTSEIEKICQIASSFRRFAPTLLFLRCRATTKKPKAFSSPP